MAAHGYLYLEVFSNIHYVTSSKLQVAIFVVLALTLRRKPDILVSLLPKLRENPKYQGHEKFPVIVWVIGQVLFCV